MTQEYLLLVLIQLLVWLRGEEMGEIEEARRKEKIAQILGEKMSAEPKQAILERFDDLNYD